MSMGTEASEAAVGKSRSFKGGGARYSRRPHQRGAIESVHPPLEGEGRTAEGSPGWGAPLSGPRLRAGEGQEAPEALSPPPGPLKRADLPPPGPLKRADLPPPGGGVTWEFPAP